MSRTQQFSGFKMASSLVVAAGLLSMAPAFAQYNGPGGSGSPPAPGGYGAPNAYAPPQQQQPSGNPAVAQFRDVLQRFGNFSNHPRYGEVWMPGQGVVPAGWSPYPVCHWQYDKQQQAWNYQDPTEWGAIVHHYGRWAMDPQAGWMWIADATYGPGWVHWRNDNQSVSWAALTPESDGQQPPTDGWQTQDQATFNAGCRAASPPPAPASYQPPPAPAYTAPVYTPPPPAPVYSPPAYVPVYSGPRLPPAPPPPVVVYNPQGYCQRSPWRPECRRPGPYYPRPVVSHFQPRPFVRPQYNRPIFRPVLARPVFRPGGFRPGGFRPGGFRPGGFRPGGFNRPSFARRPSFNRPSFNRGGGGGRGGGRVARRR